MRIFIHNCDTFIGRALCKELRKTDVYNRLFGSLASGDPTEAPGVVKRLIHRKDAKASRQMEGTLASCKLLVYDLHTCTLDDLHFMLRAMKVDPETGRSLPGDAPEATVILISSVLVWANTDERQCVREVAEGEEGAPATTASSGGPFYFKEGDWDKRAPRPGSKYEEWKRTENMVLERLNREGSTVKAHVISAGLPYGHGEEALGALFKAAWLNKPKERAYVLLNEEAKLDAWGKHKPNLVPMVHVLDLARLVRQVIFFADITPADKPFLLAVDAAQLTQREIVQGVIDEVCDPFAPLAQAGYRDDKGEWSTEFDFETDSLDAPSAEYAEYMLLDLRMEPSELMLKENFAEQHDTPGWWSRDGIVANMRKVAQEFTKERKLQAMRTVIVGSKVKDNVLHDLHAKEHLAKMICDHWSLPSIFVKPDDASPLETAKAQISSNVCRYRGYVLHGFPNTFGEADQLFREDEVVPKEEGEGEGEAAAAPPPAAEGEEEPPPPPPPPNRVLVKELAPEFVLMLRLAGHVQEEGHGYEINLTDFFQDNASTEVFKIRVEQDPQEPKAELMDQLMESSRIYMENTTRPDKSRGRPHNYLKTEREVIEEIRAEQAAREQRAQEQAEEEAKQKQAEDTNRKEEERREAERVRMIAEYEKMQKAIRDMPFRSYLMQHMTPSLTEGLIEVCKALPDDPVEHLANYLEAHAAD